MRLTSQQLLLAVIVLASLATIVSSGIVYGIMSNYPVLMLSLALLAVLSTAVLSRHSIARRVLASKAWMSLPKMRLSSRQKTAIIVITAYGIMAGVPPIVSFTHSYRGVIQPWSFDLIFISFASWAVVFGLLYLVFWFVDTVMIWARSLRARAGGNR